MPVLELARLEELVDSFDRVHLLVVGDLVLDSYVWGDVDRVVPASYAKLFAQAIAGPSEIHSIDGAGHTAELDRPDAVARAILAFID